MSDDKIPPEEEDSPSAKRNRGVRRSWFNDQPEKDQDKAIKPEFDRAHPTNADIREAVKKYGKSKKEPEIDLDELVDFQ